MANYRCSHCENWKIADYDVDQWWAYDPEGNYIDGGLIRGEATYAICPQCADELSTKYQIPEGFLCSPVVKQDDFDFMAPQECCLCGEKVTSWSRLDGNTTGKNYFFCDACSLDFNDRKKRKLVERMEHVEWKRRRRL